MAAHRIEKSATALRMPVIFALITACMPWGLTGSAAYAAERPNIVYILADDLGIGDLGAYNPDSKIPTPNLDRLAREGMRFTDVHSPSAVCTPTRYGILTGRYAWRSRLKSGVLWGYSTLLIEPGRLTVASMLQESGYATGCFGKWHLGFQDYDPGLSEDEQRVDYSKPLQPGPVTVGFEHFFGIPASLDMDPYVFVLNDRPIEQPTATVEASAHRRRDGGGFWRAGPIAPSFKHIDVLPETASQTCSWIEKQTADKPFFCYVPFSAPHTPWLPTDDFRGKSLAGYYGDFVAAVDAAVGEIVQSLENAGLLENTLLIVTSDNGSHWPVSDIERWGHAANLQYRGQKADIWEGGHRVPFLVRWPGRVAADSVSDQTICLTDLTATAAAIVGRSLKEDEGEDSVNLLPAFFQETEKPLRDAVIHHSAHGTFAIRAGKWKLIVDNLGSGGFTAPRQVQPTTDGPQGQLYDLDADPQESNNLYESKPEVVKRLTAMLDRIKAGKR